MKSLWILLGWALFGSLAGVGLEWGWSTILHEQANYGESSIRGLAIAALLRASILSEEVQRLRQVLREHTVLVRQTNLSPPPSAALIFPEEPYDTTPRTGPNSHWTKHWGGED